MCIYLAQKIMLQGCSYSSCHQCVTVHTDVETNIDTEILRTWLAKKNCLNRNGFHFNSNRIYKILTQHSLDVCSSDTFTYLGKLLKVIGEIFVTRRSSILVLTTRHERWCCRKHKVDHEEKNQRDKNIWLAQIQLLWFIICEHFTKLWRRRSIKVARKYKSGMRKWGKLLHVRRATPNT